MTFSKSLPQIFIVGCGYVGLTLGLTLASKSFDVIYVESDDLKRDAIKSSRSHFYEDGIEELFQNVYLRTTPKTAKSIEDSIAQYEINIHNLIIFITLGTPFSLQLQTCNIKPINSILEEIINNNLTDATICLRSTVSIGFTRAASLKYNLIENFCFCPERTVEGNALKELLVLPQIIAASNTTALSNVKAIFEHLGVSTVTASSFEVAEGIKLMNNTYRDFKFAFSNIVSDICNSHSISSAEVMALANYSYERSSIPKPGLVGGPCLEKDPYILSAHMNSVSASLVMKVRQYNQSFPHYKISQFQVLSNLCSFSRVFLIGLAFKAYPLTNDLRGSLSLNLISYLENLNIDSTNIVAFDPIVKFIPDHPFISVFNSIEFFKLESFTHIIICNDYPEVLSFVSNSLNSLDCDLRPCILSFVHVDGLKLKPTDLIA